MLPTPFFEPVVVGLLWTAWNFVLFLFSQHWLCERLHHLRFSFKTATYGWESAVMVAGLVKQRAAFFGFPSCRSCLAFFSVWLMVIQRLQKPKLQEQQGFCPQGENFDEREREKLQLLFLILEKFTLLWTSKVALLTIVVSLWGNSSELNSKVRLNVFWIIERALLIFFGPERSFKNNVILKCLFKSVLNALYCSALRSA